MTSMLRLALLAWICTATSCSDPPVQYLSRPGNGSTGSADETLRYYDAMTKDGDKPERTLREWMASRCFQDKSQLVSAFYYNGSDLGLGREMHCTRCTAGQRAGLISCAVTNHGVPQGLDKIQFGRDQVASIKNALEAVETNAFGNLQDYLNGKTTPRGATVAMDWTPKRQDQVRFYIYDASDPTLLSPGSGGPETLIPGLQLDGEGNAFNARIKFMRNCLTCHGGKYDETSDRILGASFLDFDIPLFKFGDDPVFGIGAKAKLTLKAANLPKLVALNRLVGDVVKSTKAVVLEQRIGFAVTSGNAEKVFLPAGWNQGQRIVVERKDGVIKRVVAASEFYNKVVHPYCSTCHFAQSPGNNLRVKDQSKPITLESFDQWFRNNNLKDDSDSAALIRRDVCGGAEMPHAQVTRNNLLADSEALTWICNAEPMN